MTAYTPEPPRLNCIFDINAGTVYGNALVDTGPLQNDGVTFGDPVLVTGIMGRALQFRGDSRVEIPFDISEITDLTASAWVRFGEDENQSSNPIFVSGGGDLSLRADATADDVELTYSIEPSAASSPTEVTATVDRSQWHHVAVSRRENEAVLYVNGDAVARGSTTNSGELTSGSTIYIGGGQGSDSLRDSYVDNPRFYSTGLSDTEIENIIEIGQEHILSGEVGEHWGTEGIPYRKTNENFGGVLSDPKVTVLRQLDFILQSRHIDTATGGQLDRIGAVAGVQRREGETNEKYRARIRATIAAGRSSGTFSDIVNVAASIVGANQDQVELREEFDTQPATAILYIHTSVFEESELTPTDVADVIDDLVVAGHEINVIRTSENAFTVRGDAQTNDPLLGFTSDEVSTGGGLAQDL